MKNTFFLRTVSSQILPIVIVVLSIFLRLNAGPRTIDDSFITYRYARNILAGNGFVFNPGEQVLGTTTPFYTLLLTVLAIPLGGTTANFPLISLWLNAIADGATCLLLYLFGIKFHSTQLGVASSLAFALAPYSVTFSIGGLETSIYVLLLLGLVNSYVNERLEWAAFLAALAFLTRPDSVLLISLIAIDFFINTFTKNKLIDKKIQPRNLQLHEVYRYLRPALIFVLPCAAWLLFAYLYFGSFFLNSVTAKALAYRLPENSALIRLIQHYATPFVEDLTFDKYGIAIGLFLYPSFALFGGLQFYRKSKRATPLIIFPWLYLIVFAIANPLIFRWYLTPPIPFYFLCIFMGIITFWEQFCNLIRTKSSRITYLLKPIIVANTIILPTLLILPAWDFHPSHGPNRLAPQMAYIEVELHYQEAAKFLRSNFKKAPQDIILAAGDVGVLGYFTESYILDTVGLNSPQTLRYFPLDQKDYVINYAMPTQLILDYLPDYVVTLEAYIRNTLLKNEDFRNQYQLMLKIDTDIFGSEGMLIFERIK